MAQEQQVVELIIDASQANAGALQFEQATARIQQSSERATASVDKLGQSIDRSGQKMGQAGQRSGAAAMEQHAAATDKATASMRQLAEAHETTIRRMQAGSFNVFDQTATLGALAQYRSQLERGVGPSSLVAVGAPERAGRNATAAAITADSLPLLTDDVFNSIHPSASLSKATRFARQAAAADPSVGADIAKIHSSESIAAGALPAVAQAAGSIGGASASPDQLLAASMGRLEAANDRVARATEAAAATLPGINSQVRSQVAERAAYGATTAAGEADFASPASLRGISSQVQRDRALADRAAYGITTATDVKWISDAARNSLTRADIGGETIGARAAAFSAALPPPHVDASQIDVGGWLQARKPPNEVDVAAWNKAREGTDSFWGSLKNLFTGARAGSADLHAAGEATEAFGAAAGHATGSAGRMREGLVLVHEFIRGDWRRAVGSATIELQRFGALGLLFNPVTIGLAATAGAMAVLINRSAEIEANLRSFDATLRVMGTGSQTSGRDLQHLVENLQDTGVSAADAKKSVDVLAQSPGLQPQSFAQISRIGRNRAALQGGEVPERIAELSKATHGGVEGLIEYGAAINAFDLAEINMLRQLDREGQSQQAMTRALEDIDHKLPQSKDLLSDFGRTVLDLENSWRHLITTLSESPKVQGTIDAITSIVKAASSPSGLDAIGGGIEGIIGAALLRRIGIGLIPRIGLGAVGGGVLGGVTGTPFAQSVISGTVAGGTLGSVIPGIGTAAGAGAGALAGTVVGAYEAAQNNPEAVSEFFKQGMIASEAGPFQELKDATSGTTDAVKAQTDAQKENTDAIKRLSDAFGARTAVSEASTRAPEGGLAVPFGPVVDRLIDALVHSESGNLPPEKQISSAGALGVAQVKLETAQEIQPGVTREQLLNDQNLNRAIGTEYLRRMTAEFGNIKLGLEAYNAGPEAVRQFTTGAHALPRGTEEYANTILRNAGLTGTETSAQLGFGLSSPLTAATSTQQAAIEKQRYEAQQDIEAQRQTPGYALQREEEILRLRRQAEHDHPDNAALQDQDRAIGLAKYDQARALANQHDEEAAQRHISQAKEINAADQQGIEQGIVARAHAAAVEQQLQQGGSVNARERAARELQARQTISAGQEEINQADTRVQGEQQIAAASQISRSETIKATIATEAYAFAEKALHDARASGIAGLDQDAAALARHKAAQLQDIEASREATEAGAELQRNRDTAQSLTLRTSLVGQGSIETERQLSYLRTRQEIEQKYSQAPVEGAAVASSGVALAEMNAALAEAEQHQQRINELFQSIANTVDGDLTNSIRNALIRTPAEAGEHLKHFWDEWRAGFKAALGDIVSGLANAAFIKPLTGEIAGALGLGQVAQQTGTFGGLFTGAPAGAAGAAGGAGPQGLSGSQLALNVSGLSNGASVFGATQGGYVFSPGNIVTVQGTNTEPTGSGTETTGAASAGLSADQIQAILDAQATPLAGSQTTTPIEAALLNISSATGAAQPAASAASTAQTAAGEGPNVFFVPGSETPISGASILQPAELPAAAAAVTGEAAPQQPITPTTATAAASSGLGSISNLGQIAGLLDKLNSNLPGFLPGGLGGGGEGGGLFGNFSDVLSSLNPFATVGSSTAIAGSPAEFLIPGTDTSISGASSLAGATSEGSLFGLPTSATFGSFLGGAGAGFGAGSLLNSLIGGNPLGGDIGSAGGAAVGSLIGSIVPGVGTLIGGLIGGLAGGGLGGLVGGPPEGQSAGAVISPTGAIQANTVGGSAANIQQSGSIAQQIGAFVTALNQLTNAQGQKIGTNLATAVVSSNNQSGITVTGTNGVGGQYDQNAAGAVSETELQIVQNLQNVSGTLKTVLANISDPSQLQAAVQFADVYDKLNVTSAQLTASLNGNVDVIGPFQQALTSIQATFSQLTAQAAQFGVDVTPITTALQAVTATLDTDIKTSLDEAFQTAISGGNDFIASLVQVHQAFEQNTSDAAALGLTNLDQQIQGIAALQAGTTLATLGIDQLTTVIQDLGQVAPEVAAQAQALIASGDALPDVLTQASQALIDPLGLAIEKEQAAGQERVAVAQQTGQSLVEVEELNSANLIQAITSAAGNPTELNAFTYANNPTAQEYLQVAPALAGFSAQQLEAVFAAAFNSSPALADLAQSFVNTGAALPDTITQSLEGIVNPLELAIQQQTAQAQARTQVGVVAGQNLNTVSALNTASITQAIVQQLGNPEALQALAAHGSAAGLTALQAGPAIAGLGLDQLTALINAIGTAAPNLTAMINALIASGNALPDALTQATEAIVESGVLAVQKAQALAYEQVQAAGPAGQNVSEAQTLGAAEVAQATAQATGTEVPLGPLPDWITQLEEAVAAPLQLAIQKQQAAGIQQVQIAEATGASLIAVQQEQADAIAQIWYQATQQLTSLKNDLTTGSLSGLTAANQVTASIEQFNTVLGLVQGGNTSFINDLASAGQAAVQAAQTAYGNGPQTQSVREQVYQAISPLLVSSSGYPSSDLAAVAAADTTSGTATGTTTDLQNNTTALENLTTAITAATPGSTSTAAGTSSTAAATSSSTSAGTASTGISGLTTNPVTGESFTGTGITAVAPNYPTFPSASTLSSALADAVASQATAADWTTINQAVQAGILNPANQPGYALVIQQAQQWAAGQAVDPSAGLAQALSDAVNGTPTLEEWELINQAVNAGILNAEAQPQYASVIRQAQVIADAQATSLSQIPNNQTAYNTTINGLPAFAAGTSATPPGLIVVGEQGPEWYQAANDNRWAQVGTRGPEIIDQAGGAQIIPFPMSPPGFAAGTTGFYVPPSAGSESDASNKALIAEVVALRKQVWASQMNADQNAKAQHALTRQTNQYVGPNISAPARRAVG